MRWHGAHMVGVTQHSFPAWYLVRQTHAPVTLNIPPSTETMMHHRHRSARGVRVAATAQLDKPSTDAVSKQAVSSMSSVDGLDDKSKLKAVHAKITAARELARRLAEEKQAVVAASKSEDAALLVRSTEEAAAAAAAQAAKADALARKLTREDKAAGGREQLSRLRAENDALKVSCRVPAGRLSGVMVIVKGLWFRTT